MKSEIKVPSVGESVQEANIAQWMKKSGEYVRRDDVLLLLETDKASVEVVAEAEGTLEIVEPEGKIVPIGALIGRIDTSAKAAASSSPAATAGSSSATGVAATPTASPAVAGSAAGSSPAASVSASSNSESLSPAVRKLVAEKGLNAGDIPGTGKDGRLTKGDVLNFAPSTASSVPSASTLSGAPTMTSGASAMTSGASVARSQTSQGEVRRVQMSMIRRRIAERLVEAQHTAAILTTFNEIDMSKVSQLRNQYKDAFKERYGVNLGFMGFFVKAAVEALKFVPEVNATIEGTEIVYKEYYHIGVAVGTEKGLIVPVIRDANDLSLAEIEMAIRDFAIRGRDGKITVDDLQGGTFTISNGGVYGSLMSTPILNPPQSGILGMHKIEDRPVVVGGQVVVRPMMYVALSYDHRLIDGKGAVTFLVRIKELIEDPQRLLIGV